MAYDIDGRILRMVWCVVAASASGCGAPTTDARTADGTVTASPRTFSPGPTSTAAAASASTVPPVQSSAAIGDAVSTPPPPESPMARCKAYQRRAASDSKGPKSQTPPEGSSFGHVPLDDVLVLSDAGDRVRCQIVWERTTTETEMMIAPTCCPTGRMGRPCPPATPELVPTERAKVEMVTLAADGAVVTSRLGWAQTVEEPPRHYCGRRPEGFHDAQPNEDAPGGRLAEMAELESAAVGAFDRLARELSALGAPTSLVERARAARRDEIRHAKVVRHLARARGATVRSARNRRLPVRSALDVALENAVEGCVFETFGAAVATLQAERAEAADVREAFARIAADERAHAALAWDVDAFLSTKLDAGARDVVAAAKANARAKLRASSVEGCASARRTLGLPTADEHRALAQAIAALA